MALFDLNDYYSSKIAENTGLLQGDIEIFVNSGLLPHCSPTNFSLEAVDEQIKSLGNLTVLSQYNIYSKQDLLSALNISDTDFVPVKKQIKYFCENEQGIECFVLRKSELTQLKQDIPDILDAYMKENEQDEEDDLDIKSSVENKPKKEETKQEIPKDEVTVTVKKKKKKKEKDKERHKKPHQKREKRFESTYNPNEYISKEDPIRIEEIEQIAKERAKDPDARARAITYDKITGTSKINKTIQEICKNGEEILSQLNSSPFDASVHHADFSETPYKEGFNTQCEANNNNSLDEKNATVSEVDTKEEYTEQSGLQAYAGIVESEKVNVPIDYAQDSNMYINSKSMSEAAPITVQSEQKHLYDKLSDTGLTMTYNNEIVTNYYTSKEAAEQKISSGYQLGDIHKIPQDSSIYVTTDMGSTYMLSPGEMSELRNVAANCESQQYISSLPNADEYAAQKNDEQFFSSNEALLTYESYSGKKTTVYNMAEEDEYVSIGSNDSSYSSGNTENQESSAHAESNDFTDKSFGQNKSDEGESVIYNSPINIRNANITKKNPTGSSGAPIKTIRQMIRKNQRVMSHSIGQADALMAIHQLKRYTAWAMPLTNATLYGAQARVLKKGLNKQTKLGDLDKALKRCNIKTNVLQQRDKKGKLVYKKNNKGEFLKDKAGNKIPVFKKKISEKDVEGLRKMLNAKCEIRKAFNADLRTASKWRRHELTKYGSFLDKNVMAVDKELKKFTDAKKMERMSKRRFGQSLSSMVFCLCYRADAVQGAFLVYQYMKIAKKGVRASVWTKRKSQKGLAKIVKPYGRHLRVKKMKTRVKADKLKAEKRKKALKRERRKQRMRTRARMVTRSATGRTVRGHKRHLKNKFDNTKVGKDVIKLQKKLSPVARGKDKVIKSISGIVGKFFGGIINVINLPAKVSKWIMIGAAILTISLGLQCVYYAGVLQLFADVFGSDVAVIEDGKEEKNLVVATKDHLLEKDKKWLKEIEEEVAKQKKNTKIETAKDPFSGNVTASTGTKNVNYFFYNGGGYDTLDKPKDKFNTSAAHKLSGTDYMITGVYSNAKAIIAATSIYRSEIGAKEDDTDGFIKFAEQLWDHTHIYQIGLSKDANYCSGKNCKSYIMDCRALSKYKDKKDFKGNKYNFAKQVKECDKTYYCNDPESYKDIVYFGKESKKKPSGNGCKGTGKKKKLNKKIYCNWSIHAAENPNLANSVPKGAKGGITYYWKSDKSKTGTTFEECKDASKVYQSADFDEFKIENAIKTQSLVLVKGLAKRDGKYLAYCNNLQSIAKYGSSIKKQDGYLMLDAKYVNKKQKRIVKSFTGTYSTNGVFKWFYECQGHEATAYKTNYCTGHRGCVGHKVTYCLGHKQLEAHVCIAGLSEAETQSKNTNGQKSLFYTDNKFWRKKEGTYDDKWKGFSDSHFDWAELILANDWERSYGIKDSDFKLRDIGATISK